MASGGELVTRKTNQVIRGLELSATRPLGWGWGLEIEFNHVTNDLRPRNETPIKPWTWDSGKHPGWYTQVCRDSTETKALARRTLPRLCTMYIFIWLFICTLYNKTVIVNITLSWVLWVVLENPQTWKSRWKAPNLQSARQKCGWLGDTGNMGPVSELRAVW